MQFEVEIENRIRQVTVVRAGDGFSVEIDGQAWYVDAARMDAHRMSLLVGEVASRRSAGPAFNVSWEVSIAPGPGSSQLVADVGSTRFALTLNGRRRKQHSADPGGGPGGGPGDAGPQRVLAPMPGKVVRVLVHAGDLVRARQPLVVVEAMKMENELRAGRNGRITAVHVQEGASVDAGTLMVVIE